jgi:ATP-dependent exoDNAse (exonuclease V) beta subunit
MIAEQAALFPRRTLPSSLVHHTVPLGSLSSASQEGAGLGGVDYGNAWHKMMETLPWAASQSAWVAHMDAHIVRFPNPQRAKDEVTLFLASPLAALLAGLGQWVRTEVPFLWQKDASTAYEGTIDCVAWDPSQKKGWVVDWKTDFGPSAAAIADQYAPQLQVYCEALQALGWGSFTPLVYSTRWGLRG